MCNTNVVSSVWCEKIKRLEKRLEMAEEVENARWSAEDPGLVPSTHTGSQPSATPVPGSTPSHLHRNQAHMCTYMHAGQTLMQKVSKYKIVLFIEMCLCVST